MNLRMDEDELLGLTWMAYPDLWVCRSGVRESQAPGVEWILAAMICCLAKLETSTA